VLVVLVQIHTQHGHLQLLQETLDILLVAVAVAKVTTAAVPLLTQMQDLLVD
jgi:hypothetical protein